MAEVAELNEFEIKLNEDMEKLNQCQKEHELTSCMSCEKVLGCEVRKTYVDAVYNSMSKGQTGGFEF